MPPDTQALPEPLQATVDRLARHDRVVAVLVVGSLAASSFTAASDYDIVVVLADLEPLWYVAATAIGGRFADVIFLSARALDEIAALAAPVPHDHALAPALRWVERGVIVVDQGGRAQTAQAAARARPLVAPVGDEAAYGAWFATNYNLAVIRRLLTSDDPLYLEVADIRMAVYGHMDLWFSYFTIRGRVWSGDKDAVRALLADDPGYLALYRQVVAETRRAEKAALYERAAAHATAPLGGLWAAGATAESLLRPPVRWEELV
ncbi:MAG: nucleotidyltransferase domain-containing protein [Chloroflexales bacterium]|nr:nucleotidyltransferase domain-containing protein [Chloroflexales bacterium]